MFKILIIFMVILIIANMGIIIFDLVEERDRLKKIVREDQSYLYKLAKEVERLRKK